MERIAWLLVGLLALAGCGSIARARQAAEDGARLELPRPRLALLPIVFSSPETGLALGVLPQYIFHTAIDTRASNIRADLYYTFRSQFNFEVKPSVWLPGNRWQLAGSLQYRKWPTSFYGIGPDAREEDEERFTEYLLTGGAEALRRIGRHVFVGAGYRLRWGRIRDVEPSGGSLASGSVPGSDESRVAALSAVVTYDTREHVYLPASGSLYRAQVDYFSPAFGGDRTYTQLTVDLRTYASVAGPVTAALQASASVTTGAVPFRLMPNVGQIVRGYSSTRLLDRHRWAVQAEIRAIPVWWRLGIAVFGGVGDVAGSIADFASGKPFFAVGAGLRFLLYPRERITIRQDFAFGRGSSGDYLDLNEAF